MLFNKSFLFIETQSQKLFNNDLQMKEKTQKETAEPIFSLL